MTETAPTRSEFQPEPVRKKIAEMERSVREVLELTRGIPAMECNLQRIMAGIAMLKLNLGGTDQQLHIPRPDGQEGDRP